MITGLLMSPGAGYQRVFWLNALVGVGVTIAAAVVVPNRARRADARVDWAGAVILAAGLCAVMLAITQTSTWGWTSMRTVTVAAAGIAILTLWWIRSGRTAHPLVSTQILRHRPVLLANMATFLVGMGLYLSFLGITDFVDDAGPIAGPDNEPQRWHMMRTRHVWGPMRHLQNGWRMLRGR